MNKLPIITGRFTANAVSFEATCASTFGVNHRVKTISSWRRIAALLSIVAAFVTSSAMALADAKQDLVANLVARKVTIAADGKESFTSAQTAKPGDVIEYQASYQNQSANELRNVQPVLPIPAGSQFIADALQPAPTDASTDGKKFEPYPLMRTVTLPDGKKQVVNVPLAEYHALRWTIESLAPKASQTVTARVRILTNTPPAAAK